MLRLMVIKILWVYIVLLELGGVIGYVKAKSKASIIASSVFAAVLILCALGIINQIAVAYGVIGFLALFFGSKFARSKKFMPSGFMAVLSVVALVLMLVLK